MIAARYFDNSSRSWKLYVRKLDEKEPGADLGIDHANYFFWSSDGSEIAYSADDYSDDRPNVAHGILTRKTKERRPLRLPENQTITDWSREGKLFVTESMDVVNPKRWSQNVWKIHLMNRDGTEFKVLTDGKKPAGGGRLAPDGKRLLFMEFEAFDAPAGSKQRGMKVMDLASGKSTPVEDVPLNAQVHAYCWSPDGKKIAYSWSVIKDGKLEDLVNTQTETFLMICDPDGKNAKTIATEKAPFQVGILAMDSIDWR
jgi:Tol biopolymer transport system component